MLRNKTIIVTRAEHQSQQLCRAIEKLNGHAVAWPLLEIKPALTPVQLQVQLQNYDDYNLAVFISPNSVYFCFNQLEFLASDVKIAVVGSGTAKLLTKANKTIHFQPSNQNNSEALLACLELDNRAPGKAVIFRGNGGRDLLYNTLQAYGWQVEYCQVYSRHCPEHILPGLIEQWQNNGIDAICISSGQALKNLATLLGRKYKQLLYHMPIVVYGARVIALSKQLGCQQLIQAQSPSDDGSLEALTNYFN